MSSRFPATHGRAKRQHDQLTAVDLRWRGVGRIASITSGAAARESGCGRPLSGRFRPFILAAIQPNRAEWRPASVHCPGLAWLESFRLAGGGLLLSKWNGHRPRRLRHGSHSPKNLAFANPSPSTKESVQPALRHRNRDGSLCAVEDYAPPRAVATWKKRRRVVAKVEWRPGELLPARRLHCHQPGAAGRAGRRLLQPAGTAEQWIKEGKNAIKWTRLSCCTFGANAVRHQLHALAYDLGNSMRTRAMRMAARSRAGIGYVTP